MVKFIADVDCVHCGVNGVEFGSFKHPYCEKCWNKIWLGFDNVYEYWLDFHNCKRGIRFYKEWLRCRSKDDGSVY